jgi:hypothetical protein
MSYGGSIVELYQQAGSYVGKIRPRIALTKYFSKI